MPSSATVTTWILGIGLLSDILGGKSLSRRWEARSVGRSNEVKFDKSQFEDFGRYDGFVFPGRVVFPRNNTNVVD